jgi:hypothetical protein
VISTSSSNRVGSTNGDISLFLASGKLTMKENISFSNWPSVRDSYLLKAGRFFTSSLVKTEYSLLHEEGLDIIKLSNSSPSFYTIENLDVFNDPS